MKKKHKIIITVLSILLLMSIGYIVYLEFFVEHNTYYMSYQQDPSEIYIMESGIIYNDLEFREGKEYTIKYDFDNEEYKELLDKYDIKTTAGNGSEFEQAKNLMNEYSGRLTHYSSYDNHIEMNAIALLDYSLDNKEHGINCRNKAQILNEMCLALGIYSRKVWIMPNSIYDTDCHVVNEVWDSKYNKWIMLDITNNMYWVDDSGNPLSVLEIRNKIANQEFCTPVNSNDDLKDLEKSLDRNYATFLYIAKNMVYMGYCDVNTKNESENRLLLIPKNLDTNYEFIVSEKVITAEPK